MENGIKLVQAPIIEHRLLIVGKSVSDRIAELNLENLVATDDTVKSLKTLRATLNKEFAEYEGDRKTIKDAVSSPYLAFEKTYKTEITEKYKGAVETLKTKIAEFENKVKEDKKDAIQSYFTELCLDADIDFIKFSDVGLNINLSVSEKKYKEKCNEFVSRISDDIALIDGIEYPVETMAEYKRTLNASKAITTIRERKEAEKQEKERIKRKETDRRLIMLRNAALVYSDIAGAYYWIGDDSVSIELKDVENLPKAEFLKRFAKIEADIKARQKSIAAPTPKPITTTTPTAAPKTAPTPLKAPVVETQAPVKEKTFKATFQCTGTMTQLKTLGQYMKDNNIEYKNI